LRIAKELTCMVLFFYTLLNVIVLILFTKKKKTMLHIIEIIMYWMVASYLFQNFSALCYMNFKTLIIPEQFSLEFAHFLNRVVLFPALMVMFLHFYLILYPHWKRLLLIISFVFLLAGLEGLSDLLGVLKHVNWKLWWSFAFWFTALLTLIGFMNFFRRILYKGGSHR
jgi:hypothetical protein